MRRVLTVLLVLVGLVPASLHAAPAPTYASIDTRTDLARSYVGARYMRAASGRFTSVDPVMNIEAAMTDPQRWNRYSYVRNNPFVFIDPDGRDIMPPAVFFTNAFAQRNADNVRAVGKVLINLGRSINSPGHMTPEGETRYFEQPDSPEEAKRMRFVDLLLTAAPLAARIGGGVRANFTRTFDLEPTHARTMSNRAFNRLKADIAENGIQEPIKFVLHNGRKYVVDGHHRLEAAKALGIRNVPTQEVTLPFAGYKTVADLDFLYR